MLQSENSGLAGRVQDLERKVLTQQDEIVCLRSTLADVLRRLNLIEGNIDRGSASLHGGRSAPNTPSRTSTPSFNRGNFISKFIQISIMLILFHIFSYFTKPYAK